MMLMYEEFVSKPCKDDLCSNYVIAEYKRRIILVLKC